MKKLILLAVLLLVMSPLAFASIGLGVRNIVAGGPGVELVVKGEPISYSIGGIYLDQNTYTVSGSAVLNNGLGLSASCAGGTNNYTVNALVEKELALGNNLSIVADINLASYNSITQLTSGLNGGALGIRGYFF